MEKVGIVGVGIMGRPMGHNLLKAGYELTVCDVNPVPVEELAKAGATAAATAKETAERSDVVITMLPDSPDVEDAVFGPDGVLAGMSAGKLFIDMSTIAPGVSEKVYQAMQEKGCEALDAPVSGGEVGATEGTMSIMCGGQQAAFDRALPIFKVLGGNITLLGGPTAGQVTKACNQIIVGLNILAVAEAMTFAKKCGIDQAKVRSALMGGFADSRILELHGQKILDRNFKAGFRIKLHRKDLNIALTTGREKSIPLYATAVAAQHMDVMIANGDQDVDHSGLYKLVEQLAGLAED